MKTIVNEKCQFCGLPFADHPQCPDCGYTYCDAKFNMDHQLCGRPEPKPPKGLKWGPYSLDTDGWYRLIPTTN